VYSPAKHQHKQLLYEIGEMITQLVRMGHTEVAQGFIEPYQRYEELIKTNDYTKEDESYYRLEEMFKK